MLLYAWLHGIFAFQYLRASLTVLIHFNRRMRLDSGFTNLLPELDRSIFLRTCLITLLQVATGIGCILFSVIYLYPAAFELHKDYKSHRTAIDYFGNFWPGLIIASIATASLNLVSAITVLVALVLVKRLISEEFDTNRKWKCS